MPASLLSILHWAAPFHHTTRVNLSEVFLLAQSSEACMYTPSTCDAVLIVATACHSLSLLGVLGFPTSPAARGV
jgi:uncharacterized membrane protein